MRDKLLRRENETKFEYIKRIVYGKLVDKTIDKDYTELSELIFDKPYSSDVARRMFYGIRALLEVLDEEQFNNVSESDLLKEIEMKKLELIKERKKVQATKLELNRNLTHESRFELFYENVKESIETLPLPEFNDVLVNDDGGTEDVQVFTDIHYGANFKSENNSYSREECKNRFERLLNDTIKYCEKEEISKLNVINLADDIQGILRISDLKLNEVPVVQAVVEISRIIATYLNELSSYVNVKYYHCMTSNHSQTRPLGSKASELATEDMELIIGNYIKDLLAENNRIEVVLSDKDYINLNLCGFDSIAMHGHQVRGIEKVIQDYSMLHRRFYQYCFMGHTHAGQTMVVGEGVNNSIEVLVTPSFVGSDPYSDSLKVGAKAMSKIYKFEENKGLIQVTNIVLN